MSAQLAPIATTGTEAAATAPDESTHLEYLARNTQACVLRPFCFFVSWQGVLTLAYRGFPAPMADLKSALTDYYGGLPRESPGSRWPKTSLGCLADGKRLSPQQLARLAELCREHSGVFQNPSSVRAQAVLCDSLSLIVYETRCLERVISRRVMQLAGPPDLADAPAEERARVQAVVAEADDDGYWFHASKDGNREQHYRSPALGATLVHELAAFRPGTAALLAAQPGSATAAAVRAGAAASGGTPRHSESSGSLSSGKEGGPEGGSSAGSWSSALPGIVARFRAAVAAEFPGLYAFFADDSLHVTVRAVIV